MCVACLKQALTIRWRFILGVHSAWPPFEGQKSPSSKVAHLVASATSATMPHYLRRLPPLRRPILSIGKHHCLSCSSVDNGIGAKTFRWLPALLHMPTRTRARDERTLRQKSWLMAAVEDAAHERDVHSAREVRH